MEVFDVVLLTADKYLDDKQRNHLSQNVRLEDGLVAKALENQGLHICLKSWSDTNFDWQSARYILVRTPWDYFERFEEFMTWFKTTSSTTKFINDAALIQWNINKNYLKELEQLGIHIPNTYFVAQGSNLRLIEAIELAEKQFGHECATWVLKPCISAGAFHTYKFERTETSNYDEKFVDLVQKGDYLLQEFQHNIVNKGELSLMLFHDNYSHAVIKKAKSGDFRVQDDYGGTVSLYHPTEKEIDFAQAVVKACKYLPDYARVDIFEDNTGKLALAELEIFEPELWFRLESKSARSLAEGIKKTYFQ